jgi:hypothetical protein
LDHEEALDQRDATAANGSPKTTTAALMAASNAINSAKDPLGCFRGRHIRGRLRGLDPNMTGITGAWHTLAAWLAIVFVYSAIIGGVWVGQNHTQESRWKCRIFNGQLRKRVRDPCSTEVIFRPACRASYR